LSAVRLNAIEAGLLLNASVPWIPNLAHQPRSSVLANHWHKLKRRSDAETRAEAHRLDTEAERKASRVRKAARRLIALGLVRGGMYGPRMVIERTDSGNALVDRRHNELHASAEHVGEVGPDDFLVYWERKQSTRREKETPERHPIDGAWLPLLNDIFQITVFRRAFMYGPLARWLPKERQLEVVKACVDWHTANTVALTKVSIRKWLAAELHNILDAVE
jgi:hypothetical protein